MATAAAPANIMGVRRANFAIISLVYHPNDERDSSVFRTLLPRESIYVFGCWTTGSPELGSERAAAVDGDTAVGSVRPGITEHTSWHAACGGTVRRCATLDSTWKLTGGAVRSDDFTGRSVRVGARRRGSRLTCSDRGERDGSCRRAREEQWRQGPQFRVHVSGLPRPRNA